MDKYIKKHTPGGNLSILNSLFFTRNIDEISFDSKDGKTFICELKSGINTLEQKVDIQTISYWFIYLMLFGMVSFGGALEVLQTSNNYSHLQLKGKTFQVKYASTYHDLNNYINNEHKHLSNTLRKIESLKTDKSAVEHIKGLISNAKLILLDKDTYERETNQQKKRAFLYFESLEKIWNLESNNTENIEMLQAYLKDIHKTNITDNDKRRVNRNPDVEKARQKFVKNINDEYASFSNQLKTVSEYAKTFSTNVEMEHVERAHIIPVWYLVKNNRVDEIENNNNGLILDPNSHRLFDNDPSFKFINEELIGNAYTNFKIDKLFMNEERKKYIAEWIENQKDFK